MSEHNIVWAPHRISISEEQQYEEQHPGKSLLHAVVMTPSGMQLSENELDTIRHMRYYMNGTDGVVLYSECAGVMVRPNSIEDMLAEAAERANEAIAGIPNFTNFNMDDGGGLLFMQNFVFCFRPYGLGGSMRFVLEARHDCLVACAKQKPIAVVYNCSDNLPQ